MPTLLVTGLSHRSGKSTVIAALAREAREQQVRAACLAPVLFEPPAVAAAADQAAAALASGAGLPVRVVRNQDATGTAPAELDAPRRAILARAREELGEDTLILVEAPGSLARPAAIPPQAYAEALDAPVLLVVRFYHGLTADDVLAAARQFSTPVAGVYFNMMPPSYLGFFNERVIPALAQAGIPVWGWSGTDPALNLLTIGQLCEAVEGRFEHGQEYAGELVEHLLVGARSWDPASPYMALKRGFAFITRHDLQDVQLAAIVDTTRCIVLTGGGRPSIAVRYRSEEAGIPLILTGLDTIGAVQAIDRRLMTAGFSQASKVERAWLTLGARADLPGLLASVNGVPATA